MEQSSRNKIISFADQYLGEYKIKQKNGGDEIIPRLCPLCRGGSSGKDTDTFALSIDKGVFVCKRGSCGRHGRFEELAKEITGEPVQIARAFTGKSKKKDYCLPETELKPVTEEIYKYFESRGISRQTVDDFRIAADKDGMIVFRFFENNVDVYEKFRRPWKPTTDDEKKRKEWQRSNTKPILYHMDDVVFTRPLIITEGQCFPGDAEVLTPNGWVRLDRYNNEPVLAVNDNFEGHFETPYAYIKKPYCGDMVTMSVKNAYYSETTADHNIVTTHETPNRHIKIVSKHKACEKLPTIDSIPRTSVVSGPGIALTNDQIALYIAVSADCTIDIRQTTRHCRFGVKKQRKYVRMKALLDNLGIEYFDNPNASKGYYYIGFRTPEWIKSKELPMSWVGEATEEQRRFILDEMTYWDGNFVKNRTQVEYNSCNKNNAVLMQTLAHTCGYVASLKTKTRENDKHNTLYVVPIYLSKKYTSCQQINDENHKKFSKYSGDVYCVSVSTGMILVKQHDCITVTGNCDAMALYEAGLTNVVSVPSGCDNVEWVDLCWDWLERFQTIILFGDNDEPGRRMVNTLIKRLGEDRVRVVENYPVVQGSNPVTYCKDANEVLLRYGEFELIDMVENATEIPTKGLINLGTVKPIDPTSVPRIKTMIPELDYCIGGLVEGGVTIMTGKSGDGKSTLSGLLLLNAIQQGYNVCAYSGELSKERFQQWINLQAAGSEWIGLKYDPIKGVNVPYVPNEVQERICKWYDNRLFLFDNNEIFDSHQAESIIDVFTTALRRYDAKLFLVDNMMTALSDEDEEIRAQAKFINALKKFANRYKVHVLVVNIMATSCGNAPDKTR